MPSQDIAIIRTAGFFLERYQADAPHVARRKYAELTQAGYATSARIGSEVVAAIERLGPELIPQLAAAASQRAPSEPCC